MDELQRVKPSDVYGWSAVVRNLVPLIALYVLALLPFVSAVTFGLFLSQLRGIAEHGVRGTDDPVGFVRSHSPDVLSKLLLYDLNYNFHDEHHRYPKVPSWHLPALGVALRTRSMFGTIAGLARQNGEHEGLLQ